MKLFFLVIGLITAGRPSIVTFSNSTDSSDLKSWSLDHAYLPNSNPKSGKSKGKLVRSKKLDYKNIMWPRDALYISYKEENFEYINDIEAQGEWEWSKFIWSKFCWSKAHLVNGQKFYGQNLFFQKSLFNIPKSKKITDQKFLLSKVL